LTVKSYYHFQTVTYFLGRKKTNNLFQIWKLSLQGAFKLVLYGKNEVLE